MQYELQRTYIYILPELQRRRPGLLRHWLRPLPLNPVQKCRMSHVEMQQWAQRGGFK